MKVSSDYLKNAGTLVMYFQPNEEDEAKIDRLRAKLVRSGAAFHIGDYDVHPDVYALACLTIVAPFTDSVLELDEAVTPGFRDMVRDLLKIEITPVSEQAQPRSVPANPIEGISFSGGVDSVAASRLLPPDSASIFSHRLRPRTLPPTLYRDDAALHSCSKLAEEGRTVLVLSNTAEHARDPAGFSTDWTTVTGALLKAEALSLASLNFGMIAEAAYHIGHSRFSNVSNRGMFRDWRKIFAYVSIPLSLPTAGLSEVVTSRIALEHGANLDPQSCVRGLVGQPCGKCYKCFRKQLLTARLEGRAVKDDFFDKALQAKPIRRYLAAPDMHLENVIAYAVHGIASQHPLAAALRKKTQPLVDYADGLSLLDRHYSPAIDTVPNHLQPYLTKSIADYADPMTERECGIVAGWDLTALRNSDIREQGHDEVLSLLGLGS